MKKILFLFSLLFYILFFTGLDVNALSLPAPTYYFTEVNDASATSGTASLVGWWGTSNYYYAYNNWLGNMSGDPLVNYRADYTFNNSNLCSNQDMLISGYVAGITGFFTNESYQLDIYNNNTKLGCTTEVQENGSRLFYSCSGKGGGSFSISLKQQSFSGVQYQVGVSKDVDVVCNPSSQDIINSGIQNTDIIVNNNNQNTQTIIDNIEDKFTNKCNNLFDKNSYSFDSSGYIRFNFSNLVSGKTYTISTNKPVYVYKFAQTSLSNGAAQSGPQTWTSGITNWTFTYQGNPYLFINTTGNNGNFNKTIDSLSTYDFMLVEGSSSASYCEFGSSTNKIDQTNENLKDINDTLHNGDVKDFSLGDFDLGIDLDPEESPVSALITLPVSLLNAFISGLEGQCYGYTIPFLFGHDLTFPCIDLEDYLGSELWNIIDLICCIFLIYNIGMMVVSFFERITSLQDAFDSMYSPRHQAVTEYIPKHGGD